MDIQTQLEVLKGPIEESFEEPLSLLVHLIEKNNADIYDIPIAEITDQYIAYIREFTDKDMESMSRFIILASTLLEIKSKMLLPFLKTDDDEQVDPREELVRRLVEYKMIKSVVEQFREFEEKAAKYTFREQSGQLFELASKETPVVMDEVMNGLKMGDLVRAFSEVMLRKDRKVDKIRASFGAVAKDVYSIEEKSEYILSLLKTAKNVAFMELFAGGSGKTEKIVTFLALLELIKQKKIFIKQKSLEDDIIIESWNDSLCN